MKNPSLLSFVLAGLLFSGYLSATKLFSGTCAFNEGCPFFLGYPACYYGFVMYFAMSAFLLLEQFGALGTKVALRSVFIVSALGILFAGYFTISELPTLVSSGIGAYLLGLPTCAWGLIVYIIIFIVSIKKMLARVE
ncbi:MAG: hypothetical protein UY04_C0036G0004 [Parcubacteria group bacterium GW2011_GWA2_47_7]|nr:MAG: hypothetical protein UY04_C0036G0004 [Parcubacteria group bacterium GW2011_GWA2_47_7]